MVEEGLQRIGIDTNRLRRVNWTRVLLPLFTIAIAGWLGLVGIRTYFLGRSLLEFALVAIFVAVTASLVLYRLEFGVLGIVLTSFLVRFDLPTGTATKIPASLVISAFVVAIWVFSMLLRRQVKLERGYYVRPAFFFMLIAVLSVPYSWLILRPDLFGNGGSGRSGLSFTFVQIGGVILMVLLPGVMVMAANVLRSERWLKLFFGLMVIVAIPELLQRIGSFSIGFGDFRLETGASYSLWIVALSVGQAFFNYNLRNRQRVLLLLLAAIWLYYGEELGAQWFSGWMPAALAVLFLSFFRSRKLFLALIVGAVIVFLLRPSYYLSHVWGDAVNVDANRFEIWQIIIFDLTLTKTNILFGAGPAGYLPFYEAYYPGHAWVSHNNYVDIFAELGVVGFSIFLWLLFTIFRTGWEQRNQMRTGFLRGFNYGVLAGFVGTLFAMGLGDWFIPFVYNIGIPGFDFAVYGWLLAGAMLALNSMQRGPNENVNAAIA